MTKYLFRKIGSRTIVSLLSICTVVAYPMAAQQNQPLLQITSPIAGEIVSHGQAITVVANPAPGMRFTQVFAAAEQPIGFSSVATSSPFQMTLAIPSEIDPGPYHITALGTAGFGSLAESNPVTVYVERSDIPSSLASQMPKLLF